MTSNDESPPPATPRPLLAPYLQLLVPLLLTHILQSAGGLLDGMWIGRLIGVHGLAAVSTFFPVFFVILSIIIGLSAAISVLVGQAWGARDLVRMRRVAGTALWVALAIGVAVSLFGAVGTRWLLVTLGTPADVLGEATRYARTVLVAMPLTFGLWACMALGRGTGDAVSPMWALAAATGVGAVATPLLVSGVAGLPPLGATGAAASNLLAQVVAFAVLLRRWHGAGHPLVAGGLRSIRFAFDRGVAAQMLRIGVPASLQMLSMAMAEMCCWGWRTAMAPR